jgi:hypothetical protein
MLLDEAEAKRGRWCPFARQLVTLDNALSGSPMHATSANRFHDEKASLCLGSGCMAWRWEERPAEGWSDKATGYCGLAGKP